MSFRQLSEQLISVPGSPGRPEEHLWSIQLICRRRLVVSPSFILKIRLQVFDLDSY